MAGSTDVTVKYLADTRALSDATDKVKSHTGSIAKYATIAGGAVAGMFAVHEVGSFIDAANESQKVSKTLAQAMKNAGDATGEWDKHAEALSNTMQFKTGVDDETIKKGQAILATFHNVSNATSQQSGIFDRATKASVDLAATGFGDVDSASKQLGKALQDPIKGLGGLAKAGVQFTQAQKDQVKAMVESGDQAGAMNLILHEVESQVGGVAEASATSSDKMKVAWGETQEAIGNLLIPAIDAILPAVTAVATFIQQTLVPALGQLSGWFADHSAIFPAVAIAIATLLVPAFIAWTVAAATAAVATIAAALPVVLLGAAIAALAYLIITNWDTIVAATHAAWDAVLGVFQGVWNWLSDNWPLLLAILTGPFGLAVMVIIDNWDAITGFFADLPGELAGLVANIGGILVAPFQWAWEQIVRIKDDIVGIGAAIVDGIRGAWNAFADGFNNLSIPSFSIGGWSTPFGDLPSWDSPSVDFPNLPHLATGGIVTRPTLALIGEAGAEAVVPLTGRGSALGPQTIIVNVTTTGLGANSAQIQSSVAAALRNYQNRGGSI